MIDGGSAGVTADDDKRLSRKEWNAALKQIQQAGASWAPYVALRRATAASFDAIDTNGGGLITRARARSERASCPRLPIGLCQRTLTLGACPRVSIVAPLQSPSSVSGARRQRRRRARQWVGTLPLASKGLQECPSDTVQILRRPYTRRRAADHGLRVACVSAHVHGSPPHPLRGLGSRCARAPSCLPHSSLQPRVPTPEMQSSCARGGAVPELPRLDLPRRVAAARRHRRTAPACVGAHPRRGDALRRVPQRPRRARVRPAVDRGGMSVEGVAQWLRPEHADERMRHVSAQAPVATICTTAIPRSPPRPTCLHYFDSGCTALSAVRSAAAAVPVARAEPQRGTPEVGLLGYPVGCSGWHPSVARCNSFLHETTDVYRVYQSRVD